MTDPIDTALLPCPFCGKSETAIIEDPPPKPQWAFVKCVRCHCAGPTCGSRATAIKRWNTRAASHADTARHEGIALGLAMASKIVARAGHSLHVEIDCLAPIPPHVAAARVLLDDWKSSATDRVDWEAVWRAMAGAKEMLPPALFFAALEQIAKEGENG